ncbi:MAG TPA: hypothetical protein HA272_01175 [Methanoregula sp.]|nr:hypothetical protein [Methanoregula sp.]
MPMTSGCISLYNFRSEFRDLNNLRTRLNNYHSSRVENRRRLTSALRLNKSIGRLGNGVEILSGIIYDEYLKTTGRVVREEDSDDEDSDPEFCVITEPYVDVRIGNFWILNNGLLISNKLANRHFISDLIGKALDVEIKPCEINIRRVAEDYPENWVGGIIDREGNWQSGTLYGRDLRNDNLIGSEFITCTKNQVGGFTEYFGAGPTKFKVSRDSSVLVYLSWRTTRDPFIGFINQEISPYLVRPEFN